MWTSFALHCPLSNGLSKICASLLSWKIEDRILLRRQAPWINREAIAESRALGRDVNLQNGFDRVAARARLATARWDPRVPGASHRCSALSLTALRHRLVAARLDRAVSHERMDTSDGPAAEEKKDDPPPPGLRSRSGTRYGLRVHQ